MEQTESPAGMGAEDRDKAIKPMKCHASGLLSSYGTWQTDEQHMAYARTARGIRADSRRQTAARRPMSENEGIGLAMPKALGSRARNMKSPFYHRWMKGPKYKNLFK